MKQLLREKEASDPQGWAQTQQQIQTAKLQRTRLTREIEDLKTTILQADVDASYGIVCLPHIRLSAVTDHTHTHTHTRALRFARFLGCAASPNPQFV